MEKRISDKSESLSDEQLAPKNQNHILCARCEHIITRAENRISIAEKHEHTFFNPAGKVFEICCFSEASGLIPHGAPSAEFSWFAGFIWQITLCAQCGLHMGWRFNAEYSSFFGLIKKHLIQIEHPYS